MKLLLSFLLLISTSILTVNSFSLNPFGHKPDKYCFVKAFVRTKPAFEFYNFVTWEDKIAANQKFYDDRKHLVWVDAPDKRMCRDPFGKGVCCLKGYFYNEYEWAVGPQGQKIAENQRLLSYADRTGAPEYQVWVDAPDRYCTSNSFFGF